MPLRPLRAREVIRKLERAGFRLARQRGSHARHLNREDQGVTVPIHPGDSPIPVVRSIMRQAGISQEEWDEL